MQWNKSTVISTIDFESDGKQIGDLRLPWSNNEKPAGYHAIPVAVIKRGNGPTLLLNGGVHGDEYIGPSALLEFIHEFNSEKLNGRIIVIPALNAPAVRSITRCSPLDGVNLNRAFGTGQVDGPTSLIAHFMEDVVLPACSAVVDIHSGGQAHLYASVVMAYLGANSADKQSLELAKAFGTPFLWSSSFSEQHSMNAAAIRKDIPMIALELGGGIGVTPEMLRRADKGIYGVLEYLEMVTGAPSENMDSMAVTQQAVSVGKGDLHHSDRDGLFVRAVEPESIIAVGDVLGKLYSLSEPEREPVVIRSDTDGVVLAISNRGKVTRGDLLVMIASLT